MDPIFDEEKKKTEQEFAKNFPVADENLQKFAENWLSSKNEILAATLNSTKNWKRNENVISFEASSNFEIEAIEKARSEIENAFFSMFGLKMTFSVQLKKVEAVDFLKDAPKSVKILCEEFNATVISKVAKTNTQNAQRTEETAKTKEQSKKGDDENEEIDDTIFESDDENDED